MNGLNSENFDKAGGLLDKLDNVRHLQSQLKYNTEAKDITSAYLNFYSADENLMNIISDGDVAPFEVSEFIAFSQKLLAEKEKQLIGDLKLLGVNVGPHSPAPDAPTVERLKTEPKVDKHDEERLSA